jgi:hypothetical protein
MPDDEKYARMVAQTYDLDQSIIRISQDIIKDLPEIVMIPGMNRSEILRLSILT